MHLIEIKPPISQLLIFNERCLRWRAEKYEEDTEVYKVAEETFSVHFMNHIYRFTVIFPTFQVTYSGSRDYQDHFHDSRKRILSSKAAQMEVCLNLLPVTNYSIWVTALRVRFTATITTHTGLPGTPAQPGQTVFLYHRNAAANTENLSHQQHH